MPSHHKVAVVAVPALAIAGQSRRHHADAAVQRCAHSLPRAIVEVRGVGVAAAQYLVEPARHQQARRGAQPAEPTLRFRIGQSWMGKAGR